jgi:hypothetical protein
VRRLVKSAKFWTLVTGVLTIIVAKLKVNLTVEELTLITSLFATVIAAIMGEDIATAKAKAKAEAEKGGK